MSGLATWQQWLWAMNVCVQISLCYLIVRRDAYKNLPYFLMYLVSDLAQSAITLWAYRQSGFSTWSSLKVAWLTQAAVTTTRGMAVAEVCKNSLRQYEGIWALGWRVLGGVGALVVFYAGLAPLTVSRGASWGMTMTLAAQRGLELALVAVLLSLLVFTRYYRVVLTPPHKMLAIGFCFFSSIAILNDTILSAFLRQYTSVWNGIKMASYFSVLVAWCWALYRMVPARAAAPVLFPQTVYEEYAPQFNYRLRLLNDRLAQVLKS